eukprot:6487961-Amphidinium_carterae.1
MPNWVPMKTSSRLVNACFVYDKGEQFRTSVCSHPLSRWGAILSLARCKFKAGQSYGYKMWVAVCVWPAYAPEAKEIEEQQVKWQGCLHVIETCRYECGTASRQSSLQRCQHVRRHSSGLWMHL